MPDEQVKTLIVDDEPAVRHALRTGLAANGYAVEEAGTGDEALISLRRRPEDLVLLDINMPGLGGVDVCRRIRGLLPRVGIVMITVRDSEDDRVQALEAGADDYLSKPFRLRELVARLRAVTRRIKIDAPAAENVLRVGDIEVDLEHRTLKKSGELIHVSPTEFNLLAYLMERPGEQVGHATLLRAVWGPEYGGELEYLRTYIRMLRRKIEADPSNPKYLVTDPWIGYRFRIPSESAQSPAAL
ncbi:MAG TPA: response regulator transcription factor [Bryobacteraceae bacterium]|nr:response regulator transcription factor [Bryobacteraceae bacterium]